VLHFDQDRGAAIDIDAIDWAWIISGRAAGTGVLANPLPL
jgi:hypothetical protein